MLVSVLIVLAGIVLVISVLAVAGVVLMTWVLVLAMTGIRLSDTPSPQVSDVTISGYSTRDGSQASAEAIQATANHSVPDFSCIPGLDAGGKQARSGP